MALQTVSLQGVATASLSPLAGRQVVRSVGAAVRLAPCRTLKAVRSELGEEKQAKALPRATRAKTLVQSVAKQAIALAAVAALGAGQFAGVAQAGAPFNLNESPREDQRKQAREETLERVQATKREGLASGSDLQSKNKGDVAQSSTEAVAPKAGEMIGSVAPTADTIKQATQNIQAEYGTREETGGTNTNESKINDLFGNLGKPFGVQTSTEDVADKAKEATEGVKSQIF